MANERNPEFLNGLLIPWQSDKYWTTHSTVTQAEPRPGVPVPQQEGYMTLVSTGTQTAGKTLDIKAVTGGHPQLGGAQFHWRYGAEDWRGCDVPNAISHSRPLVMTNSNDADEPHIIALQSGDLLVAYRYDESGSSQHDVYCQRMTHSTGAWTGSGSHVAISGGNVSSSMWPTLCQLPSGRILCAYYRKDTAADEWQVRVRYSDDDGDTWSTVSRYALTTAISADGTTGYTTKGLRMAYKDGQILLIAYVQYNQTSGATYRDTLMQYASSDLGATFDLVKDFGLSTNVYGSPDLFVHDGRFYMGMVLGTASGAVVRRVASAYEPLDDTDTQVGGPAVSGYATWTGGTKTYDDVDCAAWVDEDGAIYLALRYVSSQQCVVWRSDDGGESWLDMGENGSGTWSGAVVFEPNSSSDAHIVDLTACAAHGRSYLVHASAGNASGYDASLHVSALGGYTNVVMPAHDVVPKVVNQVSWEETWLPLDFPSDMGWSRTNSGTSTRSLGQNGLRLTTTTGTEYYTKTAGGGTPTEGVICRFACQVNSGPTGSSTLANTVAVRFDLDDGTTNRTLVAIRFSTVAAEVWDETGTPAKVGSTLSVDMTSRVEFLVALVEGAIKVWYRADENYMLTDRYWTEWVDSSSLGQNATSSSALINVYFGHYSSGTANTDWWEMHFTSDEWTGQMLDSSVGIGGTRSIGRTIVADPQYVDDGVHIQATDGPAYRNDEWEIATRYRYALDNVWTDVAPSPRKTWRSTQVASNEDIAIKLDGNGDDQYMQSDLWGVVLEGINFGQAQVQVYESAAWSTLETVYADNGAQAVAYARAGDTVRPNTGASITRVPYYEYGELVGGYIDFDGGGTFRKIVHNTEGYWDDAATRRCVITLEGEEGTTGLTGTCDIYPPRMAIVIHNEGRTIEGVRIRIPAAAANGVDGYFEIGSLLAGPIVAFGWETSWGRKLDLEPNVQVTTAQDGTRRSRVLGPARRAVEVAWADGVDTRDLLLNEDDDYIIATTDSNGEPVALRGDAPYLVRAIIDHLDGPHTPIVWIPRIDQGSASVDSHTYTRRRDWLYGRIVSSASLDSVQGDENKDEVFRIQALRIEEEV